MSYRPTSRRSASARPLAQAIAVALSIAYASGASAAAIVVNVATDTSNVGECSLRDAIVAARGNAAVNGCVAGDVSDIISFNPAVTSIVLASSLPQLGDGLSAPGQQLVIQGPGAANLEIVVGDFMTALLAFTNTPALTVDGVTLRASTANASGGIVMGGSDLTVRNSSITGAFSTGITHFSGGAFVLENSTVSGARFSGVQTGGSSLPSTPVTIRNSTFTGNALGVDARSAFGVSTSVVTIENSTFHANTAVGRPAADLRAFGYGGTLTLNLRNTTLTGDTASRRVVLETSSFSGGTVNAAVDSSLFGGPVGSTDIDVLAPVPFIGAAVVTLTASNSLFSEPQAGIPETAPGTGNQFGVSNPGLDALANNGGPTQTRALQVGSPAINTGSNPAGLTTDQRGPGFPRTIGAATDVGAFELVTTQNIQVFDPGNTLVIADGDASPDVADGTDFGSAAIGTPVARTYTIRNSGDSPLAITAITSGNPAFVVSGVPGSVAAGGSATFTVTFTPTASGLASTTITLDSDDPDPADDPYTFAVQGTGQALQNVQVFDPGNTLQIADGDVTPAAADGTDFGATPVGTPVVRTYTLRNTGDLPLAINSIISSAPGFTVSGVPASVPALGSATFTVTYTAAASGVANATITVASNDPDPAEASYTFAVTGSAFTLQNVQVFNGANTIQIADADATPSTTDGTDFGTTIAGTPVARTFTIRNTGTQLLTINSITSGSPAFTVSGVPASVAGGATATFTVTLAAGAVGPASSTITVASNDPDPADASYTFAVQGTVAGPRDIDVYDPSNTTPIADGDTTPSTLDGTDFGDVTVGTSPVRSFTIRNSGGEPLTITGIASSNPAFVLSGVPASVPGGGTATFTVTFNATTPGLLNTTITLTTDDPDPAETQFTLMLQGNVVVPNLVVPAVIPTLSTWAMTLLAAALAALGWRRRESVRVRTRA